MSSSLNFNHPNLFFLTEAEVKALDDYFFNRAGYISFEFDHEVIKIVRRIREHIKGSVKPISIGEELDQTNL